MPDKSPLEAYKKKVMERISVVTHALAYLSFGDYSHRINLDTLEDDEFAEIICGLDILKNDLAQARKLVEIQNNYALLRTEIWKCATAGHRSENDLIQDLLNIVGPHINAMRASYFSIDRDAGKVSLDAQWCRKGVGPNKGLNFPFEFIAPLVGNRSMSMSLNAGAFQTPAAIRNLMMTAGIGTMFIVVNGAVNRPFGFFAFSDSLSDRTWTKEEESILFELVNIVSTKIGQIAAEESLRLHAIQLENDVRARTADLDRTNRALESDIEQRKKAEKELRESEEKFRSLAEKSPNIIFINCNSRVVYANERASEVLGYPRSHFYSDAFELSSIIAPESWPEHLVYMRRHTQGEDIPPYELMVVTMDGRRINTINTTRLITFGGSKAIMGIITDITEKKKLEEELIRSSKLDSIGVLAGGIAHDFNNVLTGIISNMFMAKMNLTDDPETCQFINEAEKAAYRASKLTKQLLTFAKGGAPVKEVASLKEIIEDAVGFCLSGSRVDYKVDLSGDLYAVEVDKGQIDQVLNNLIINADQAMPDGGTLLVSGCNIKVSRDMSLPLKPGHYVKVCIKDTGTGIPSEAASKIFDPYFSTKKTGTGLGLTTAYSIIQKHSGHLCFESLLGLGTTFSFYLPASQLSLAELEETRRTVIPRGSGRVLIMDDDEIVRTIMEKLLQTSGFEPQTVNDGAAAIVAYKEAIQSGKPFEVVVMDLTIQGGMGGRETAVEILAFDPGAKLIVVSGYSNDPVMSNYRDYGFSGVVCKPFTLEEFASVINSVKK